MSRYPVAARRDLRRQRHLSARHDRGRLWRAQHFGDFDCLHCGRPVAAAPTASGVNHRNHCPYCLWSKHVDLETAGDRLSACLGGMAPIGLAFKRVHKKYAPMQPGELMLVHRCQDCGAISYNRLALDDLPPAVWDVYQSSLSLPAAPGLALLDQAAQPLVQYKLVGSANPTGLLCLD